MVIYSIIQQKKMNEVIIKDRTQFDTESNKLFYRVYRQAEDGKVLLEIKNAKDTSIDRHNRISQYAFSYR